MKPTAEEIERAREALAHVAKWEADGLDGDPELAVMKQDAEAVLRAAGE